MNIESELLSRSGSKCELCGAKQDLVEYNVSPDQERGLDGYVLTCAVCIDQIEHPEKTEANHWRGLSDAMWSEVPGIKVVAYRMLHRLKHEGWPADLLEMLYLDDEVLDWAKQGIEDVHQDGQVQHMDSNGQKLEPGDTVVLIKDLKVKGANFIAKRGTAVRRISLVADNPDHIEGRVNDQHIVILTQYVKKSK
jgi:protein PhnA